MPIAIISDLHSNLEAVTEVLKDIRSRGVDAVYCLGDIVGYGPEPLEVIELCYDCKLNLLGNHDEGVLKTSYGFNPIAREAIEWTREVLRPGFLSGGRKKRAWSFLRSLPVVYKTGDILFVHASPRDPVMEYVLRADCQDIFGRPSEKIVDIFSKIERLCFAGHTHDPGVIVEDGTFLKPVEFDNVFRLEPGRRYFVNVGSVGQPRDGDPRACYVIFDGDSVEFRRVEYDFEKTRKKIHEIPRLDRRLGDRLTMGK